MMMILRTIRINNFKASCIMLGLLFVYDVFWVFVSPSIFKGNSVMVVVATGLDLPIKLVAPSFDKFQSCSLLGLGDMVIPGLHIMFVR